MTNKNNTKGGSGDFGFLSGNEPSQKTIKGLDNGVLNRKGSTDPSDGYNYGSRSNINFAGLVAKGENGSSSGFQAFTPNGVQTQSNNGDRNSDYKWGDGAGGKRWSKNRDWEGDTSGN